MSLTGNSHIAQFGNNVIAALTIWQRAIRISLSAQTAQKINHLLKSNFT
jgi:hypothetical protein